MRNRVQDAGPRLHWNLLLITYIHENNLYNQKNNDQSHYLLLLNPPLPDNQSIIYRHRSSILETTCWLQCRHPDSVSISLHHIDQQCPRRFLPLPCAHHRPRHRSRRATRILSRDAIHSHPRYEDRLPSPSTRPARSNQTRCVWVATRRRRAEGRCS